ncbi:Putative chromo/chromo shadow domain, Chromo-like domain superfamily protein [Septoria linicola]|uniref:Chromo/chromo shadow domain, Chromo-like domain superfamily protein n=1 Tax=Septoria linicola TaxID=215465 RepID=A0A9Q9ER41_9PEZI|nr:Putative chromo/chromo shadow domain, Chromo-like domain superfamily protein [Septoria linicola]
MPDKDNTSASGKKRTLSFSGAERGAGKAKKAMRTYGVQRYMDRTLKMLSGTTSTLGNDDEDEEGAIGHSANATPSAARVASPPYQPGRLREVGKPSDQYGAALAVLTGQGQEEDAVEEGREDDVEKGRVEEGREEHVEEGREEHVEEGREEHVEEGREEREGKECGKDLEEVDQTQEGGEEPADNDGKDSVDTDQEWDVKAIAAQDGNQYLLVWSGTQPNGEPWPPTWEPHENISKHVLKAWTDWQATAYDVEKVLRHRKSIGGKNDKRRSSTSRTDNNGEYLVRWAGKHPNGKPWPCTWEPEQNIGQDVLSAWSSELQVRLQNPDACESNRPAKVTKVLGECPYDAGKLLVQLTKRQMMVKVENVPYGLVCAWDGNTEDETGK